MAIPENSCVSRWETIYKERIENILDELAGKVEVRKSDIDRNQIIEHDSYLNALLDYIILDFRRFRREQNDETVQDKSTGKGAVPPLARTILLCKQSQSPTRNADGHGSRADASIWQLQTIESIAHIAR